MNPEVKYYCNGQITSEEWKNEAREFHRLDGPVYKEWYEDGQLRVEKWFIDDEFHRLDGPAYREWFKNGLLRREIWFINGVRYNTEAEFQVAVDLYKANEIVELF